MRPARSALVGRRLPADRQLIARAKRLVMRRLGLGEAAAFRLLRKSAMDRRTSLTALARILVDGEARPRPPARH